MVRQYKVGQYKVRQSCFQWKRLFLTLCRQRCVLLQLQFLCCIGNTKLRKTGVILNDCCCCCVNFRFKCDSLHFSQLSFIKWDVSAALLVKVFLSVTVLQVAVDKGIVMPDCWDKAETLVEQRDTVDRLEQSKLYQRYEKCELVSEDWYEIVWWDKWCRLKWISCSK